MKQVQISDNHNGIFWPGEFYMTGRMKRGGDSLRKMLYEEVHGGVISTLRWAVETQYIPGMTKDPSFNIRKSLKK